ncbi:MAG TPA: hypothetical protein VMF08_17115 [Candidatus Sulfotelmatobacter sp.]|nr:hypothetical protein [Candidatus Sulfotelmatobacter sp.]
MFKFVGQLLRQSIGTLLLSIDNFITGVVLAHHFGPGPQGKFAIRREFVFNPVRRSGKYANCGLCFSKIQQAIAKTQIKQTAFPLVNACGRFHGLTRRYLQWGGKFSFADAGGRRGPVG